MVNKFTLLLLGPAGSGKSTFVAGISKLDIFQYITAKKQGGANTTKIATTYEFTSKSDEFRVIECETVEREDREEVLNVLQQISSEEDGIQKVFEKINDSKFAKKCLNITIQLPCKDGLIPENSLFDTIVLRDSRGFGDIDDRKDFKTEDLGVTDDVNAILFMSISSIQQPAVFSKIIEDVMKYNLKTPMFLLRRDEDLIQNDIDFEQTILTNIENTDKKLRDVITSMDTTNKQNLLNHLVFNIPEVKSWKGALNINATQTQIELNAYSQALQEIVHYSFEMYMNLYKVIAEELQDKYKDQFVNEILNELISEKAFEVAASIATNPMVIPSTQAKNRDTAALASPVQLTVDKKNIGEEPYRYERSRNGNGSRSGIIPSYSYACVNFRNIFNRMVNGLSTNHSLVPLFSTLLDIVLEDATVKVETGYTNRICPRNAFKFNLLIETRDKCTSILREHNLVHQEYKEDWNIFSFKPFEINYSNEKAIAVFVYQNLILSLNLSEKYKQYQETKIHDESFYFVEKHNKDEVLEKLQRN